MSIVALTVHFTIFVQASEPLLPSVRADVGAAADTGKLADRLIESSQLHGELLDSATCGKGESIAASCCSCDSCEAAMGFARRLSKRGRKATRCSERKIAKEEKKKDRLRAKLKLRPKSLSKEGKTADTRVDEEKPKRDIRVRHPCMKPKKKKAEDGTTDRALIRRRKPNRVFSKIVHRKTRRMIQNQKRQFKGKVKKAKWARGRFLTEVDDAQADDEDDDDDDGEDEDHDDDYEEDCESWQEVQEASNEDWYGMMDGAFEGKWCGYSCKQRRLVWDDGWSI
eukprot:gnl/TRDRNA2_/TRDRNA2_136212_c0_seq1.p1 gnl/TRDRNA2_/TRDRNA2_136212_c0~~gnl/TRDRNA2_/TRDRNA2_136212_c0_seq1.p1  ORF type:complete len:282 (+),score=60.59 gnl/TRDRNA2_/TRDRNA2_136212_c0_seq1:126-971(+)